MPQPGRQRPRTASCTFPPLGDRGAPQGWLPLREETPPVPAAFRRKTRIFQGPSAVARGCPRAAAASCDPSPAVAEGEFVQAQGTMVTRPRSPDRTGSIARKSVMWKPVLLGLGASMAFATAAFADISATAITDLNMRSGPGPEYPVLAVIGMNDPVV